MEKSCGSRQGSVFGWWSRGEISNIRGKPELRLEEKLQLASSALHGDCFVVASKDDIGVGACLTLAARMNTG
jgi:hypothetical protein